MTYPYAVALGTLKHGRGIGNMQILTRGAFVLLLLLLPFVASADVPDEIWEDMRFEIVHLKLKDDTTVSGKLIGVRKDKVTLKLSNGSPILLEKKTVKELRGNPVAIGGKPSDIEFVCNYSGHEFKGSLDFAQAFSPNANAQKITKETLDTLGLSPTFIVVPNNAVPNAAAIIRLGYRYVLYNNEFINKLRKGGTNWAVYSVMAHEIGHHLNGHTLRPGGGQPPLELEADKYSGYVIALLGGTLSQASTAMKLFGSAQATSTHPGQAKRLKAIGAGWNEGIKILSERGAKKPAAKKPAGPAEQKSQKKKTVEQLLKEQVAQENKRRELERKSLERQKATIKKVTRYPQGLPRGTETMPCGCHGIVRFGATQFNPRCASGFAVALPCPFMCPFGGSQWNAKCL